VIREQIVLDAEKVKQQKRVGILVLTTHARLHTEILVQENV